ncbi:MAG: protease modulator HflK family protein [Desulfobacterales bacterium]|nr:protease modulator HflK family protein [Desulfobacterales bacterium]
MAGGLQLRHQVKWSNALKTAVIVLGVNIVLTAMKFGVFRMSGSLAVLAEAWHSFTDIATSLLVSAAILIPGARKAKPGGPADDAKGMKPVGTLEIVVSVLIGMLLLGISGLIFKKVMVSQAVAVQNPLLSGIIFIAFSIGSFLVSCFETQMGKNQASLGLVSDGMHARADMFASLLTGFSLILYAMGINIDRWMAAAIGVIIFCLAMDTLVNAYRVYRDKNGDSLYSYRFLAAFFSIFTIKRLKRFFRALHPVFPARIYKVLITAPIAGLFLWYASTACYTVSAGRTAVVERFGKPLGRGKPIQPGLHFKLPWPVDRVVKVSSAAIKEIGIGNVSASDTKAYLWTLKHGSEEAFLTGDNNFFYPYIILHYKISDPFQYLYNYSAPEQLLNEIGHRAAVSLFARESFYGIATTRRAGLQKKMKQDIQAALDRHGSGIELIGVNFKDVHPPISIAPSFEMVIAGFQEKQELINLAIGYANSTLPEFRGKAEHQVQTAAGESAMRLSKARGEAERFTLRLPETPARKKISMSRIHGETMKEALKYKTKIIVDPDAGAPDLWINVDNKYFD